MSILPLKNSEMYKGKALIVENGPLDLRLVNIFFSK